MQGPWFFCKLCSLMQGPWLFCNAFARRRGKPKFWIAPTAVLLSCRERPDGRSSFLAPGVAGLTRLCFCVYLNATLASMSFWCVPPVGQYPLGIQPEGECEIVGRHTPLSMTCGVVHTFTVVHKWAPLWRYTEPWLATRVRRCAYRGDLVH